MSYLVRLLSDYFREWSAILMVAITLLASSAIHAAPLFPLKAGTDGRRLVDQNNVPFLIKGEAAWSLVVGMQKADASFYLADRRAKGFNTILIELIEHEFTANPPYNAYGDAPFTKAGDFSTPNEAYFAHADWIINEAAKNDFLVLLTPAYIGYACGSQGWCQEMLANGTTKMFNYGVYLANRYKDFKNILWVNAGDADAGAFGASAVVRALAEGIKSVDTSHLHTAHCDRQSSALDCYDEAWLDINNTYSDCASTGIKTNTDYNRARLMPYFYIEGQYENDGAPNSCIRAQAYTAILGGSTGHVYGNWPVWYFGSGWKSALNAPGAQQMAHLSALFGSRTWQTLVPDYAHQTMTAGYGNLNDSSYVATARSSDGASVIAYLPGASAVTIDMTRIAGTQANAWWFNPETGAATAIGTFTTAGSKSFSPPASGDWVLVLDNAALNLPAPGTISTASADLWLTKTASATSVNVGDAINYTLTVTNQGPSGASGVTVTDSLPPGVAFVSATSSQGSCSFNNGTITCNLGSMAAGGMSNVQVGVTALAAAVVTNNASVTAIEVDANSANNSDSVQTTVLSTTPAPTLTLNANPTSVVNGGGSTLTWSSTNATTCTAGGGWSGSKAVSDTETLAGLSATLTYTLTCTGSGGSVERSATITVTPAPAPTSTFTATPATVAYNASSTLAWTSTNSTSCAASGVWSGAKATSGSEGLTGLKTTGTYTLTCTGAGGSVSKSVTVTVTPAAPPSVTLTAAPTSIAYNGTSTLSWSSTAATACVASGAWSGAVALTGTQSTAVLTANATYTLTCTGDGGSASSSALVTVQPPPTPMPTVSISATPAVVNSGSDSTLSWTSTNVTSCAASGAWSGARATSGTLSLTNLTSSGTYTLACTGAGGTASQSTTITVSTPAPTVTFSAVPSAVLSGGSTTLTWSSTNASTCTATGDWSGVKSSAGSESMLNLTSNKTYTLSCSGAGGSANQSMNISVSAPAPELILSAAPASIASGGSTTLTWASTNTTTCTASGHWNGLKTTAGSQALVNLTSDKTYTLTCTGIGGVISQSVAVTVLAAAAPTLSLTSAASDVALNGTTTLSWVAENATSCTASGSWDGARAASGSEVIGPLTASTTFVLTCSGSGGTVTSTLAISVTRAGDGDSNNGAAPASAKVGGGTFDFLILGGFALLLVWRLTNRLRARNGARLRYLA